MAASFIECTLTSPAPLIALALYLSRVRSNLDRGERDQARGDLAKLGEISRRLWNRLSGPLPKLVTVPKNLARQTLQDATGAEYYVFAREDCRHEKNNIAPIVVATSTIPGLPSGTVEICLSRLLSVSLSPLLPFPLSRSAYANAGRIKVAAIKAQTLLMLF
jgi:hypothetical protein